MSDSAVTSWSGDAAASRLGRLCLYAQVAFFGGLALVVAAAFALFALRSVQTGAYGQLALVALLALVGGPYSLLYLLPLLTDDDSTGAASRRQRCLEPSVSSSRSVSDRWRY